MYNSPRAERPKQRSGSSDEACHKAGCMDMNVNDVAVITLEFMEPISNC
jgi:hypothetical protein